MSVSHISTICKRNCAGIVFFDAGTVNRMCLQDKKIFSSWSGGKDSCLALYKAMQSGGRAVYLLTMMTEQGQRSRSHGLHRSIIEAQAAALSLPFMVFSASWDAYEEHFVSALGELKDFGITDGIFGDIDLEPHREWVEKVCARQNMAPHLPLWQQERRTLLADFINAGFAAIIVAVNNDRLDNAFLGRTLDWQTIDDLEKAGVDACGEEGEYHTVVTDGPIFSQPLILQHGDVISHDGYSFLNVTLTPIPACGNNEISTPQWGTLFSPPLRGINSDFEHESSAPVLRFGRQINFHR